MDWFRRARILGGADSGDRRMETDSRGPTKRAAALYRTTLLKLTGVPAKRRRQALRTAGLVLVASVAYALTPAREANGPRFLIAQRDVPSGVPVTSLHFGMVPASQAGSAAADTVSDQELHLLKGSLVNLPLRRGELLRRGHLKAPSSPKSLAERIPLGSRAYLLEDVAAAKVRPGDRIDLNFVESGNPAKVFTLGDDLLVLDTNQRDEMTLAVSMEDLETIELARSRGRMAVVVRNPRDTHRGTRARRPRFAKAAAKPARITIIHEGEE